MTSIVPLSLRALAIGLWQFRYFILSSIRLDFLSRIRRSRLGVLWIIAPQLTQVAIFSLILSRLMSERLPGVETPYAYPIYLMAGMAAWSLFVDVFTRALNVFIDNAHTLKKITFPKLALAAICYGIAVSNNLIFLAVALVGFVFLGHFPTSSFLWLPLLFLIVSGFGLSLGLLLGVFNVFVRDVGHFAAIALQIGFWFTPIVYLPTILPQPVQAMIEFNPMYWMVVAYHDVLVFDRAPALAPLLCLMLLVSMLSAFAIFVYQRASAEMVDVL